MSLLEYVLVFAMLSGLVPLVYFLRRDGRRKRAKEKEDERLSYQILRAAGRGPFFCESVKGDTLVLVRKGDYECKLAEWHEEVIAGKRYACEKIVLVVAPTFLFFKSPITRENFCSVGSWSDAEKIKTDAIRIASGLSEQEFEQGWWNLPRLNCSWNDLIKQVSLRSSQIFIPFSSTRMVTPEEQQKLFGGQTLESAREFLLAGVSCKGA